MLKISTSRSIPISVIPEISASSIEVSESSVPSYWGLERVESFQHFSMHSPYPLFLFSLPFFPPLFPSLVAVLSHDSRKKGGTHTSETSIPTPVVPSAFSGDIGGLKGVVWLIHSLFLCESSSAIWVHIVSIFLSLILLSLPHLLAPPPPPINALTSSLHAQLSSHTFSLSLVV